jgi:hypothetical protein
MALAASLSVTRILSTCKLKSCFHELYLSSLIFFSLALLFILPVFCFLFHRRRSYVCVTLLHLYYFCNLSFLFSRFIHHISNLCLVSFTYSCVTFTLSPAYLLFSDVILFYTFGLSLLVFRSLSLPLPSICGPRFVCSSLSLCALASPSEREIQPDDVHLLTNRFFFQFEYKIRIYCVRLKSACT